jgi:DNA/RNA-binding domain of Phe-tRNA-synthetase-like protein
MREVAVAPDVAKAYPGTSVSYVEALVGSPTLAATADKVWHVVHERWHAASRSEILRHPHVVAYRAFAASLGLDPDKQPPSIQALIDRGLRGRPPGRWPRINPVVDLLNAVAVDTMTALGVFDADRVSGAVRLAFTTGGENFQPLGGSARSLPPGRLVLADDVRVLSLFAERDGVHQAVTPETTRVLLLGCAVPGVAVGAVRDAVASLATRMAG